MSRISYKTYEILEKVREASEKEERDNAWKAYEESFKEVDKKPEQYGHKCLRCGELIRTEDHECKKWRRFGFEQDKKEAKA